MRDGEVGRGDLLITEQQDVEVDRARPLRLGSNAAEVVLDLLQVAEQLLGTQSRVDLGDSVRELGLLLEVGGLAVVGMADALDARIRNL